MVNIADLISLPEFEEGLARVDKKLRASVATDDSLLTEIALHLIAAGGKRLRPSLAIAAALTSKEGSVPQAVVDGGAAVELVHLGSLYHDDVLDGALMRRTVPSVNAKYDDFLAIIAGDFLLARASAIAAELGSEVTAILARTIGELCEGQVREHKTAFDLHRTVESYRASISGKTASLLGASARIGAVAAEMPKDQVDAVATYSHSFGMAFQIRDDIIDVLWTEEKLGKPAGNDLYEGIYTLPTIHALESNNELRSLLGKELDQETHARAMTLVRDSGGIEVACGEGIEWSKKAQDALAILPDSAMKSRLGNLASGLFEDIS